MRGGCAVLLPGRVRTAASLDDAGSQHALARIDALFDLRLKATMDDLTQAIREPLTVGKQKPIMNWSVLELVKV